MLPGWHMGAFELMNTGLVKVFIMSSCSEHMLDPEKHLSFNQCLSSSSYFKTKCCDSEFISSVSFSNSHLLMAAQLFLFSVMTPTVGGKKREWELCFVFPWGVTNRQCALCKENVFIFKRDPKQWDFIMAYLQIIIHRHFNITNFLPLEEMFHRLHFSFCGQLSNLSSYYPESFCGTVDECSHGPLCWVAQRSGWPRLGSAFQMAAATDESPAGAWKGVCNYIMIPNRLHAFRSFQCCQLTCVSLGLVANEWKWFRGSPQSWGLYDAVRFKCSYLCSVRFQHCKSIVGVFVCLFFIQMFILTATD